MATDSRLYLLRCSKLLGKTGNGREFGAGKDKRDKSGLEIEGGSRSGAYAHYVQYLSSNLLQKSNLRGADESLYLERLPQLEELYGFLGKNMPPILLFNFAVISGEQEEFEKAILLFSEA